MQLLTSTKKQTEKSGPTTPIDIPEMELQHETVPPPTTPLIEPVIETQTASIATATRGTQCYRKKHRRTKGM